MSNDKVAPVISIVIPVYNAEKFLRECLDSIFSQTFKDFELICVNDGSKDRSLEILKEYASTHQNMVLIDQENKGIGSALNRGIQSSGGKYLYSLDNDDTLADENVLQRMVKIADDYNLDILTFNYTTETKIRRIKQPSFRVMTGQEYLLGDYIPPLWSKFCRMDYIRQINFRFLENISFVDTESVPRLLWDAQRVMHIDDVLYKWRRIGNTGSSVSQNLNNIRAAYAYAATTRTYDNLSEQAESGPLKSAMKKERFKAMIEVTRITATVNTDEAKGIYDKLLSLDFSSFEKFLIRNEEEFFRNTYVFKKTKIAHPWVYLFRKVTKLFI